MSSMILNQQGFWMTWIKEGRCSPLFSFFILEGRHECMGWGIVYFEERCSEETADEPFCAANT